MLKRKISILLIIIIFSLLFISPRMLAEEDSLEEIRGKLMDISQEEKEILDFLFTKSQEIDELKREKDRISQEIGALAGEIQDLDKKIQEASADYEDKLALLEAILQNYQRMGPASYIEIILDSDNIRNLLRRINTLRDLTRNTGLLLGEIDDLKEELLDIKASLDEKLNSLEAKEDQLATTIEKEEAKAQELETYLDSLMGDREYYQDQLNLIMTMMEGLADLIGEISEEFAHIVEKGNLPEDSVKIRLTSKGLLGTIEEDVFNQVMADNPNLPEINLGFYEDQVEMELPEENLLLIGNFHVLEEQGLKFQVEKGNFYGLHLKEVTLEELFGEGDFILDLESLLGRNSLENIESKEGYLELTIGIRLFK